MKKTPAGSHLRSFRHATGRLSAGSANIAHICWRRFRQFNIKFQIAAVIVAIAVISATIWALLPSGPQPRARQYLAFKACLLTDSQGVTGATAAPVWQQMEKSSVATLARVQYLPVMGPATVGNALPYLASLTQRHCDLIVAAGPLPVAAVTTDAARYPHTHFVVVGATATDRNITVAASPAEVRNVMTRAVRKATG